jgi:hypothetical protein
MDFASELNTLIEYTDYSPETVDLLKNELTMLHCVYPQLTVNRGWGLKDEHNIGMVGTITADFGTDTIIVPFGICYPLAYPNAPPLCNIIPDDSFLIIPNPKLTAQGSLSIHILRNWTSSFDSFEVIRKCARFISKHKPILFYHQTFVNEMWEVRRQIDELIKDKYQIERARKEVQEAMDVVEKVYSEEGIRELMEEGEKIGSWVEEYKGKRMMFEELFWWENEGAKRVLEIMAEEEACEEAARKVVEGFYLRKVGVNECFVNIKQVYYERFLLMKKREAIMKHIR